MGYFLLRLRTTGKYRLILKVKISFNRKTFLWPINITRIYLKNVPVLQTPIFTLIFYRKLHLIHTGHFLYTESLRHGAPGDIAEVVSRTYTTQSGRSQCLSFSYTVYGRDQSSLHVHVKDVITGAVSAPWSTTSRPDSQWETAQIQIYPDNQFQVLYFLLIMFSCFMFSCIHELSVYLELSTVMESFIY